MWYLYFLFFMCSLIVIWTDNHFINLTKQRFQEPHNDHKLLYKYVMLRNIMWTIAEKYYCHKIIIKWWKYKTFLHNSMYKLLVLLSFCNYFSTFKFLIFSQGYEWYNLVKRNWITGGCSLVVRIPRCGRGDLGSNPSSHTKFSFSHFFV